MIEKLCTQKKLFESAIVEEEDIKGLPISFFPTVADRLHKIDKRRKLSAKEEHQEPGSH